MAHPTPRPASPDHSTEALVPFGWDGRLAELAETALEALRREAGTPPLQPGRVIAVHRERSVLRLEDVDVPATLAGRLRHGHGTSAELPAVGDWVLAGAQPDGPAVIRTVLPRRTELRRQVHDAGRRGPTVAGETQVLAANVDLAVIADSFGAGPNLRRLERYLALVMAAGAEPLVLLNKADLVRPAEVEAARRRVESIAAGVEVLAASVLAGDGVAAIRARLGPGRTAVVIGPSGAGKSTLVNGLLGRDRQATRAVRGDDQRGRHTTTHRELFLLPGGGMVIDTPGIRSLELSGGEEDLEQAFEDVAAVARSCRFPDCKHGGEPGCAVAAAIASGELDPARVDSARKLAEEARRRSPLGNAAEGPLERKRRAKSMARAIRQHERLRRDD